MHKKQVMAAQLQSKAEEEDIRKLEFQAQQRMQALEQAALHEASLAKLRDEVRPGCLGAVEMGERRVVGRRSSTCGCWTRRCCTS